MSEQAENTPLPKPHEFDARAFIRGASVAHEDVTVFTDAATAWELAKVEAELAKAEELVESLSAGTNMGITHSEGHDEAEAEVEALKARELELTEKAIASKMTFSLRGLSRKQVALIDKKHRKAIKPAARKNYADDMDGEEEYNLADFERNRERNEQIAYDLVASSIYKVTDSEGTEDTNVWSLDDAEALAANLYDSEWYRIYNKVQELTFSEHVFRATVERDADFLSKP